MGPKSNHTCILMRKREGDLPQKKDHVTIETEIGVMWPQAKKRPGGQELEGAKNGWSPRCLQRKYSPPGLGSDSRHLASSPVRE